MEDHDDTRELIRLILLELGYEVTTVDTVAKALATTSEEIFELYLLDSRLPDGSGVDLCKQLRVADSRTPIVFIQPPPGPTGVPACECYRTLRTSA